ncbi:hypothetical protein [Xenorhabdus littoralis]|uniref:hypothetical protein n=1 Tax=Xenorhabdus littoralis TaxID=2582835 RepID=UPI0029E7E7A8|nr:hypothetical protein [Xenorhabdus sp. psl]MDX7991584.1 hypothetical protein [Xenorhabdus sp. psl]
MDKKPPAVIAAGAWCCGAILQKKYNKRGQFGYFIVDLLTSIMRFLLLSGSSEAFLTLLTIGVLVF